MAIFEHKDIGEVINERKFVEMLLEEQYADRDNLRVILNNLARYCWWDLGYRETRTKNYLKNYILNNLPDLGENEFNHITIMGPKGLKGVDEPFRKTINFAYNHAKTRPLFDKDGIWITQSELDRISELEKLDEQKVAFVSLCYAKIRVAKNPKSKPWIYHSNDRAIRKHCRISRISDYCYLFGAMYKKGLAAEYEMPSLEKYQEMSVWMQNEIEKRQFDSLITFINDDSPGVIFVDDWRELGYYYLRYKGERIIKCSKCGKLMRGNKNGTKKYCNECCSTPKHDMRSYRHYLRCEDCGRVVTVSIDIKTKKRCRECQKIERKRHNQEMYEKRKAKKAAPNSTKSGEDDFSE